MIVFEQVSTVPVLFTDPIIHLVAKLLLLLSKCPAVVYSPALPC